MPFQGGSAGSNPVGDTASDQAQCSCRTGLIVMIVPTRGTEGASLTGNRTPGRHVARRRTKSAGWRFGRSLHLGPVAPRGMTPEDDRGGDEPNPETDSPDIRNRLTHIVEHTRVPQRCDLDDPAHHCGTPSKWAHDPEPPGEDVRAQHSRRRRKD